jgi:hypothetical protein
VEAEAGLGKHLTEETAQEMVKIHLPLARISMGLRLIAPKPAPQSIIALTA